MAARAQRYDHKRAAKAAPLVAALLDALGPTHPARPIARELEKLFKPRPVDEQVRLMLERVPGKTLAAKAERIGIKSRMLWELWHGRYRPNPDVMARIEQVLAEEKEDA